MIKSLFQKYSIIPIFLHQKHKLTQFQNIKTIQNSKKAKKKYARNFSQSKLLCKWYKCSVKHKNKRKKVIKCNHT